MSNVSPDKLPEAWLEAVLNFHCPRYAEFPQVELYMDQVLKVIEQSLAPIDKGGKEKLITSTMVNNYVKQGVVQPPQKKRYNRTHLAYLMVVCVLKQVLPIADICRGIRLQIAICPVAQAYDYFCESLESALVAVFTKNSAAFIEQPPGTLPEAQLVRAATLAFANKVYLQTYLQYVEEVAQEEEKTAKK